MDQKLATVAAILFLGIGGSSGQLGYGDTETIGDDELPRDAGDVPLGR